jgi:MFS family permease
MAWGVLPILLAAKGFSIAQIGIVTAIYPAVWGIGQLFTGKMSDIFCKKDMLFLGMSLQGIALILLVFAHSMLQYSMLSVALGFGTAMVYPTFLATIAENTHPADRAGSLGVFRFWRDAGYAIGALLTGLTADWLGVNFSVILIGLLTIASAVVVLYRKHCTDNHSLKIWEWVTGSRHRTKPSCNNNMPAVSLAS